VRLDEMKKAIEGAGYRVLPPPSEMQELRDLSGLTIRQVAARSGVSVPRVCNYERGELELRPEQVQSIRRVLLDAVRQRQARMAEIVGGRRENTREAVAV
jgi:transcriptional regulator with XRE-family HTH domain